MSQYEKVVRKALWQTTIFLLIAIASLLLAFVCAIKLNGHNLKTGLLGTGTVMAIAALIAQNRYTLFTELLTPNTFGSNESVMVLLKYRKYESASSWVLLLLAVLGVLVGAYGSLIG